jgi:hypothetical protein
MRRTIIDRTTICEAVLGRTVIRLEAGLAASTLLLLRAATSIGHRRLDHGTMSARVIRATIPRTALSRRSRMARQRPHPSDDRRQEGDAWPVLRRTFLKGMLGGAAAAAAGNFVPAGVARADGGTD